MRGTSCSKKRKCPRRGRPIAWKKKTKGEKREIRMVSRRVLCQGGRTHPLHMSCMENSRTRWAHGKYSADYLKGVRSLSCAANDWEWFKMLFRSNYRRQKVPMSLGRGLGV